jgi:hypothetical protein
MTLKSAERQKLNRQGHQLLQTEKVLSNHVLTRDKWMIVQAALNYLDKQVHWQSAGPLAKHVITLQAAFLGCETDQSLLGFIGPSLKKLQDGVIHLMGTALPADSVGSLDFLTASTRLMTTGMAYLTTQTLGQWKGRFPFREPIAAKKGGMLLQELGFVWLFGSRTIDHLFGAIGKELGLDERGQKTIRDIGVCYMLLLVVLLTDEEKEVRTELLETLTRYFIKPVDSVEKALEKAFSRGIIEEPLLIAATGRLQMIKISSENRDMEALRESIVDAFDVFELPYQNLKKDVHHLAKFCSEMSETFNNFFYKAETVMTTLDQSA